MNLIKLAWKNIIHNPLNLLLNLILLALGIGLINFILLLNDQLKEKFDNNLADIDLVIGAKGSPLQMILCSMYHIDNPTGNIEIGESKAFLRNGHPLIKRSVPLSVGDNHNSYRIVGTDHEILSLYEGELKEGKLWNDLYEVTAGAEAARALGIDIGYTFESSHGFSHDEDQLHEGEFKVVGILEPTGSVLDQLLLCNTASVWAVHDHGDSKDTTHAHHKYFNTMQRDELIKNVDQEITSILIQYKNRTNFQALSMPRNINENTDLQAASPAYEINRLYDMMGTGTKALQLIALLIAIVSAISIFVSLLNSLKQRKYELSLLRVMGGRPRSLLSLILLEGLILSVLGFIIGYICSQVSLILLADDLSDRYNYQFTSWAIHGNELTLFLATISLGLLAALLPALLAYKTDIHKNLSQS